MGDERKRLCELDRQTDNSQSFLLLLGPRRPKWRVLAISLNLEEKRRHHRFPRESERD